MKAILVIDDISDKHLWKTLNDIFDRMKGYKCSFKQMPQKFCTDGDDIEEDSYWQGWNECIDAITGETE